MSSQIPGEWQVYIGATIIFRAVLLIFSPGRRDLIQQILVVIVNGIHKGLGLHEFNTQVPLLEGTLLMGASHELTHIYSRIINRAVSLQLQLLIINLDSLLVITVVLFSDLFNPCVERGLPKIEVSLTAHVLKQPLVIVLPL